MFQSCLFQQNNDMRVIGFPFGCKPCVLNNNVQRQKEEFNVGGLFEWRKKIPEISIAPLFASPVAPSGYRYVQGLSSQAEWNQPLYWMRLSPWLCFFSSLCFSFIYHMCTHTQACMHTHVQISTDIHIHAGTHTHTHHIPQHMFGWYKTIGGNQFPSSTMGLRNWTRSSGLTAKALPTETSLVLLLFTEQILHTSQDNSVMMFGGII